MTDYVTPLDRAAKSEAVATAFAEGLYSKMVYNIASIENKWNESSWAKKLACRAKKTAMTDFCRFKARAARKH